MAVININSISDQIDKVIKEKVERPIKKVVDAVAKDVFFLVSRNSQAVGGEFGSPVFTGQYYNNHRVSLNRVDTSTLLIDKSQFEGGGNLPPLPLSTPNATINAWKPGDSIITSNSLPYAAAIEFEKLSFFKTPDGVYTVAARAVQQKYKDVTPVIGIM